MGYRIGIDLGGTKIEGIVLHQGRMIAKKRIATPQGDYTETLRSLVQLVQFLEAEVDNSATVGVGIPGSLSKQTGRVKNANSTCLIGQDLQGDLQQCLNRPVRLANDANCFALSEASDGSAQGAEVVFGVIIGTGCGGGVVVKGQILQGINAIGGEWGHNPLPWATKADKMMPCYCGLSGCNETFLSGPGMAKHYHQQNEQQASNHLTAQQIVALAEQGNRVAKQHLDTYCTWLAKGLASVINLIDPDVIVLGGGLSNIQQIYSLVPNLWQNWVFSDQVQTHLRPPKWGDSSGVRGAAWLWSEKEACK